MPASDTKLNSDAIRSHQRILFIYLFSTVLGLCCCSQAFSSFGVQAYHCSDFSWWGAQARGVRASAVTAHRLSSCGWRAYLPCGVWDLLRSGIKLVSPALQDGFLTTGPPGKPGHRLLRKDTKIDGSWFVSCLLVCLGSIKVSDAEDGESSKRRQ